MKKKLIILFFTINSSFLYAQSTLKIEGTIVNIIEPGNSAGVNIPRSLPTKLSYRNNSITAINAEGYMLQAGDEAPLPTNNNLDGKVITGNKFIGIGT